MEYLVKVFYEGRVIYTLTTDKRKKVQETANKFKETAAMRVWQNGKKIPLIKSNQMFSNKQRMTPDETGWRWDSWVK